MKTTIYANYGVLAHEKQTVYSTCPISDVHDKLTVEIPESLNPYTTVMGEIGVEPADSGCFGLCEVLTTTRGNCPAVKYVDCNKKAHVVSLAVVDK